MAIFTAIAGLFQVAVSIFSVAGPLGAASSEFVLDEQETDDDVDRDEGASE